MQNFLVSGLVMDACCRASGLLLQTDEGDLSRTRGGSGDVRQGFPRGHEETRGGPNAILALKKIYLLNIFLYLIFALVQLFAFCQHSVFAY